MNTAKRVLLCALIVAVAIAMVPLWGRTAPLSCLFMWRYAISSVPGAGHSIVPLQRLPSLPPLCMEYFELPGYAI